MQFEYTVDLPVSHERLWELFSDPRNLARLQAPELKFQVQDFPENPSAGDYWTLRARFFGINAAHTMKIETWDAPRRIVETQVDGPFAYFSQECLFIPWGEGSRLVDRIHCASPTRFLGPLIDRLYLRPRLDRFFTYRNEKIREAVAAGG